MLRKNLKEFIPRTLLQPFLLVFVFTYVFPKIGQGVGGSGAAAGDVLDACSSPAWSRLAIIFQGIQSVALPLVQEFGYTTEIEDRVLAPLPVALVAIEKIVAGRAAAACSPRCSCSRSPRSCRRRRCTSHINWLVLLTLAAARLLHVRRARADVRHPLRAPARCRCCSASSCCRSRSSARIYYSWSSSLGRPIAWLQIARARQPARVHERGLPGRAHPRAAHVAVGASTARSLGFAGFLTWQGIEGFRGGSSADRPAAP